MTNDLKIAVAEALGVAKNFRAEFELINTQILEASKNARGIGGSNATPKDTSERVRKNAKEVNYLNESLKQEKKLEEDLIRVLVKKEKALTNTARQITKQRFETQQLNKVNKEEAVLTSKLSTEYQKLVVKMNQVGRTVQDLTAKKAQGKKLSDLEQAELKQSIEAFNRYNFAVRKANLAIKRHQIDVGNYGLALKGLARSFRSLMSAFGLTSAVFIFAGLVKDALNRVREFDKTMQNLAGVFRTTRAELAPLEETIINVASATVRTSNEVATLAETLATLGKSSDQIEKLLKPIIDLSLGLDAPADEAGEFLIQMLNAFGKSEDSAEEFADTIATIRTSTTLDFQRMRDGFQYIAPISRILNKDLAFTGAIVGILADNGLKAEQASRLLGTAQIKLATQGKTLDQALKEINEAYKDGASGTEILALANDSFGKQASKVGAILALNTGLIEKNAQAIRDNGGALEDLTNQQLESFDARIKIVDSSYERFILKLEKSNGIASKFTKGALTSLTNTFNSLSIAVDDTNSVFERWVGWVTAVTKTASPATFILSAFTEKNRDLATASRKTTDEITAQNKAFIDSHGSLGPLTKAQQEYADELERINGLLSEGNFLLTGSTSNQGKKISELKDEIKKLQEEIEELDVTEVDSVRTKQEQIKVLQEQLDKILGVKRGTEATTRAIEGSIAAFQKQIGKLKQLRDATALTTEQYDDFTDKIRVLEFQVSLLDGTYEDFLKKLDEPIETPDLKDLFNPQERVNFFEGDIDADLELEAELERIERLKEANKELFDTKKELYRELQDLAINSINSIFEAELNRYDESIDENQEYYDNLLENENLTDKEREDLEDQRDKRETELERKKKATEKKAFLFGQAFALGEIAIDTAKSVAKIKAQAAILAANPITAPLASIALSQIPFVIGTGAAAAASVVATSVPQFKDGHLEGTYSGDAIINDERGSVFKEIVMRNSGKMETFEGRNKKISMNRGDKVIPASLSEEILNKGIALSYLQQQDKIAQQQIKIIEKPIDKEVLSVLKTISNKKMYSTPPSAQEIGRQTAKAFAIENRVSKR